MINRLRRHLRHVGLAFGAIAGAAYTAQSAPHMIVTQPHDKLIVGGLLSLVGGAVGWLCGAMAALPFTAAEPRGFDESNGGGQPDEPNP